MKRDMDLVRVLLLKIGEAPFPIKFSDIVPETDGQAYENAAYNLRMLVEEVGFVKGIDASSNSGEDWLNLQLTWYGSDFLENVRDPGVWQKTMEAGKKVGGFGIEIMIGVAKEYLKEKIKTQLGFSI